MHKFTDDTTLSENVQKGSESDMQRALDAVLEWSQLNHMNINCKKTKEMVLGSFRKYSSTQLTVASVAVERLPVYKLLGIAINCTVKWDDHVATVISSAAKRLWFLKKLKPAGVSVDDPVHYYQSIRPALEYACAVWQPVRKKQTQSLANVQRRALQIIFGNSPRDLSLSTFQMSSLCDGRRELYVIV